MTVVHSDRGTQRCGCFGVAMAQSCFGCVGAWHRELTSWPTFVDDFSVLLSITVLRGHEMRDINPHQGERGVQIIFIVISNVAMTFNVVADRCGANSDRCVPIYWSMFIVVSYEHGCVTLRTPNAAVALLYYPDVQSCPRCPRRPWIFNVVADGPWMSHVVGSGAKRIAK